MTAAQDIHQFILSRFGGPGSLIVKDGESETGLRSWDDQDTAALLAWLAPGRQEETSPGMPRICHNIDETAEIIGVGTQVVQNWLRRDEHPLPHIQHGRRIIIPRFMLMKWIREECDRDTGR